jgi:hypothetical protein
LIIEYQVILAGLVALALSGLTLIGIGVVSGLTKVNCGLGDTSSACTTGGTPPPPCPVSGYLSLTLSVANPALVQLPAGDGGVCWPDNPPPTPIPTATGSASASPTATATATASGSTTPPPSTGSGTPTCTITPIPAGGPAGNPSTVPCGAAIPKANFPSPSDAYEVCEGSACGFVSLGLAFMETTSWDITCTGGCGGTSPSYTASATQSPQVPPGFDTNPSDWLVFLSTGLAPGQAKDTDWNFSLAGAPSGDSRIFSTGDMDIPCIATSASGTNGCVEYPLDPVYQCPVVWGLWSQTCTDSDGTSNVEPQALSGEGKFLGNGSQTVPIVGAWDGGNVVPGNNPTPFPAGDFTTGTGPEETEPVVSVYGSSWSDLFGSLPSCYGYYGCSYNASGVGVNFSTNYVPGSSGSDGEIIPQTIQLTGYYVYIGPGPSLTVTPPSAAQGSFISIGVNSAILNAYAANDPNYKCTDYIHAVLFNGVASPSWTCSGTGITAQVPSGLSGSVTLQVTGGLGVAQIDFTITGPVIISVANAAGDTGSAAGLPEMAKGGEVYVRGTGLGGVTQVTLSPPGSAAVATLPLCSAAQLGQPGCFEIPNAYNSDTELAFQPPSALAAGSYEVGVSNGTLTATGNPPNDEFHLMASSLIVTDVYGPGSSGDQIGVNGGGFLGATGVSLVSSTGVVTPLGPGSPSQSGDECFGCYQVLYDYYMVLGLPAVPAGTYAVVVTGSGGASSPVTTADQVQVVTPSVYDISPNSGMAGDVVQVDGDGIDDALGITVDGVPLTAGPAVQSGQTEGTWWSVAPTWGDPLQFTLPDPSTLPDSGPYDVVVDTPVGEIAAGTVTITAGAAPTITSVGGNLQPGGWLPITGTNLQDLTSCTVNGVPAPVTSESPTQAGCVIPMALGTGTYPLVISNPFGVASSSISLAWGAAVASAAQAQGNGVITAGSSIVVYGNQYMDNVTSGTINGVVACSNPGGLVFCTVPSTLTTAGTYDLVLTNPDGVGQAWGLQVGFGVPEASLAYSDAGYSAPITAGTLIDVLGNQYMNSVTSGTINGEDAQCSTPYDYLYCTVPSNLRSAGSYPLILTNPDGTGPAYSLSVTAS